MIGRRGFLIGIGALIAAPAIVRVTSIMPVRSIALDEALEVYGWSPAMEAIASLRYIAVLTGDMLRAPEFKFVKLLGMPPSGPAMIGTDGIWRGMPGGSA